MLGLGVTFLGMMVGDGHTGLTSYWGGTEEPA